jgi:uncharacterized protein involved in outer membrane biogenesis
VQPIRGAKAHGKGTRPATSSTKSRGLLIALLALGGLLAVAVLGVAAVLLPFDPEDDRDDAGRAFLERTGRELELAGPLQVSIFPWLAVETGAATVGKGVGKQIKPQRWRGFSLYF